MVIKVTGTVLAVVGFIMLPALAAADTETNISPNIIKHYKFNSDTGVSLDARGVPASNFRSHSVDAEVNADVSVLGEDATASDATAHESRASSGARLQIGGSLNGGGNDRVPSRSGAVNSQGMELSSGGNLQNYLSSRSTLTGR